MPQAVDPHPDEICSICQDNLSENVVRLKCRHMFHKECILEALRFDHRCPLCRVIISAPETRLINETYTDLYNPSYVRFARIRAHNAINSIRESIRHEIERDPERTRLVGSLMVGAGLGLATGSIIRSAIKKEQEKKQILEDKIKILERQQKQPQKQPQIQTISQQSSKSFYLPKRIPYVKKSHYQRKSQRRF